MDRKKETGFTLIETLIYIALFGIILTGVITAAYPLITGADRLSQRVTAESEAQFVLHKIGWALSVTPISSIDVTTPGKLRILQSGGGVLSIRQGETTLDSIEISDGGVFIPLTASRVKFSNFSVTPPTIPAAGNAPHQLTVSFTADGESFSQTYNTYYP